MKQVVLLICAVFVFSSTRAQVQYSGWLASVNTFKVAKKISLHFDAQLRSADKMEHIQTLMVRPGVNVHLNKSWTASAGYAFVHNRRSVGAVIDYLPEHRIWQQTSFGHKIKHVSISHRLRFEERFISRARVRDNKLDVAGFDHAFRFRYFVRGMAPFRKHETFSKGSFLALQNEVFLNTGDKTVVNGKTFDQNRLYAAIGYRLPGKVDLETGYMNQYIATASSSLNNHIVQIAVYKRL